MNLSLNEVEATAKRAARGAGYPWGLAEEASKAARWLCARDIDGSAALARLLAQVEGVALADMMPNADGTDWTASGGVLCPLATGAAVSDRSAMLQNGAIRLGQVAEPVLLVSFAALAARQLGMTVGIEWSGGGAVTDGDDLSLTGDYGPMSDQAILRAGVPIGPPNARRTRAEPADDDLAALNRFAHRTYAPATEESRLKGAGAGLSDND